MTDDAGAGSPGLSCRVLYVFVAAAKLSRNHDVGAFRGNRTILDKTVEAPLPCIDLDVSICTVSF